MGELHIPVGAEVRCGEERCGKCTHVVINPTTDEVTHIVVQEAEFPHVERLVPIEDISESTPELIQLRCTREQLGRAKEYIEVQFARGTAPYLGYQINEFMLWPYAVPAAGLPAESEQIPPGEMTLSRGASVEATDGRVGHVEEFLLDPDSGGITHIVIREGRLWGHRDIVIPVSQIGCIERDTVYLKMNKEAVGALPEIPIKR